MLLSNKRQGTTEKKNQNQPSWTTAEEKNQYHGLGTGQNHPYGKEQAPTLDRGSDRN